MRLNAAVAVICLSAFWLSLVVFTSASSAQCRCLACGGNYPLLDWNFVRTPARVALPYSGAGVGLLFEGALPIDRADICNPPLAMLAVRLLPKTKAAGWTFSFLSLVAYLAAAGYYLRRRSGSASPVDIAALALAVPVIFAVQVGNTILFAAAAALLFLADYDAKEKGRRRVAALALAVAFAFKIAPVLLGLLYFGRGFRKRLPEAVLSAVVGFLLLVLPFAFYGGAEAFVDWFANADANATKYAFCNPIGLCGVWAGIRRESAAVYPYAMTLAACCLGAQGFARGLPKITLAVAGMLMLPPTMMIYTLNYLLPVVLALSADQSRSAAILGALGFIGLAMPLQLFVGGYALQPIISALSLFVVIGAAVVSWLNDRQERICL